MEDIQLAVIRVQEIYKQVGYEDYSELTMLIHLNPTKNELRHLKAATRKVHVGDCVEACNEMWLCHSYNVYSHAHKCDLCDFRRCDIPCSSVCCSTADRKDGDTVYFTNYK